MDKFVNASAKRESLKNCGIVACSDFFRLGSALAAQHGSHFDSQMVSVPTS